MKTIRILAFFFYSVLFSNITIAQTAVEGSWLFRDSVNDISLFFKDDGVFTLSTKSKQTLPKKM